MIFRSAVFRKLLISALLLIAIALVPLDFYLTRYIDRRERELMEERLAGDARILAGELARSGAWLEAWARDAAHRARARVTVIDRDGVVLADSERPAREMENHGHRPEVQEAYSGRIGHATRRSATLDTHLSYVAYPVDRERPGRVLRLAVPLRQVRDSAAEVHRRILVASTVAAAAALALAWFFSRSFTGRVHRLKAYAEALGASRAPQQLNPDSNDELGALAASLTRAAVQLHQLVDRLSVESSRRETILSSMMEGVLAVDSEMRVTFCNDAFARAVGVWTAVPERLPLLELVRDPALVDLLSGVIVSGKPAKQRVQLLSAEGRSFEVQVSPLTTGSRRGALAILHDITDLERLERVRKDFVANVSHELRTPLTAIRGYAETLLDGALDDQENNWRFLEKIRAHAIRLNNIASDLLVLSEMESGQGQTPPEPVSVRAAVESALRTVESEARVREVRLKTGQIDAADVMGYRIRLEQALVNLLDNATKFNRPGGEVTIDSRVQNGHVKITVADTGIGIPSEDLPRIFERFYRVDKARSREVGGTGLGLSIVKHIIERMNGTIQVESQLGKGSRFTVSLPCC
jgi:two-component system phosphate regulon sensor histidine kinase PhoR